MYTFLDTIIGRLTVLDRFTPLMVKEEKYYFYTKKKLHHAVPL